MKYYELYVASLVYIIILTSKLNKLIKVVNHINFHGYMVFATVCTATL